MDNFSEQEKREIVEIGFDLIDRDLITGINLIESTKELPKNALIIHYLHNSQNQISFILNQIAKFNLQTILLPRETYYILDPIYTKKPNFTKIYKTSSFFEKRELKPRTIEDVINDPKEIIVKNKELDLLIPLDEKELPSKIVSMIYKTDKKSPERWTHPAIILKGEVFLPSIPGFIKKDYISLCRKKAEFYAIALDKKRKRALKKYMDSICREMKKDAESTLKTDSVLYLPSQINPELDLYFRENI